MRRTIEKGIGPDGKPTEIVMLEPENAADEAELRRLSRKGVLDDGRDPGEDPQRGRRRS